MHHFLAHRNEGTISSEIITRAAVLCVTSILIVSLRSSIPATARCTLWARSRRVCASVLAMRNPQVRVLGLVLDTINGLDGVRDVREVYERTVPKP
jgi:hypothetical protein